MTYPHFCTFPELVSDWSTCQPMAALLHVPTVVVRPLFACRLVSALLRVPESVAYRPKNGVPATQCTCRWLVLGSSSLSTNCRPWQHTRESSKINKTVINHWRRFKTRVLTAWQEWLLQFQQKKTVWGTRMNKKETIEKCKYWIRAVLIELKIMLYLKTRRVWTYTENDRDDDAGQARRPL